MSTKDHQIGQHYEVLVGLTKSESWVRGDLESTLREVTEAAARTMHIQRVNVWLFDEGRSRMRCIQHYDRSTGEHSAGGAELAADDYPAYFRALAEERTVVANEARVDPSTSEFTEGYLDVHGITSLLDAPLRSGGKVVGIIVARGSRIKTYIIPTSTLITMLNSPEKSNSASSGAQTARHSKSKGRNQRSGPNSRRKQPPRVIPLDE